MGIARVMGAIEGVQMPPRGTDSVRIAAPDPKGQSWLDFPNTFRFNLNGLAFAINIAAMFHVALELVIVEQFSLHAAIVVPVVFSRFMGSAIVQNTAFSIIEHGEARCCVCLRRCGRQLV